MSVDEGAPKTRRGDGGFTFGNGQDPTPRIGRIYPDWRNPPLPSSPTQTTPGGYRTVESGGASADQLIQKGCRIPILYGRLRIYPDVVGDSSAGLGPTFYLVISEGPIDAIESWNVELTASAVSLGSLSPTSGLPSWSIGLACAYLNSDPDAYGPMNCLARGRKLFDPRLGAWGSGEYPDAAKTAYSKNPALIMADLLCFPQYGIASPSEVDWQSVEDAADWCDEIVSGAKRYEIGGLYMQAGKKADEWWDTIGLHTGLRWRQTEGLWTLAWGNASSTSGGDITEDDIARDDSPEVSYGSGAGLADLPNRFIAEWTDPTSDVFAVRQLVVARPEVDAGAPPRDSEVYKLHGFQSETMAKRALERIAAETWAEVEIDLPLRPSCLDLDVGSVRTLQLPTIGLVGVDVRIVRMTYDANSVRAVAQLVAADSWTAPTEAQLAQGAPAGTDDPTIGSAPSVPAPPPASAPSAPVILPVPPPATVPLYRSLAEDPAPTDGQAAVFDATTGLIRFEDGGAGPGGSPLTVKESDGTPSVADVTEIRVSGATVTNPAAGVVEIAVPAAPSLTVKEADGSPSVASVTELQVEGATVASVSAGVAKITVPTPATPAHNDLSGRSTADAHPASAVSFTPGTTGLAATDVQAAIEEVAADVASLSGSPPVFQTDSFSATAAQTTFALAHSPVANGIVYVSRNGVIAAAAEWTLSGSDIVFGTGLDAETSVQVGYWRTAPTGASPAFDCFTVYTTEFLFTLSHTAGTVLLVAVNGIVRDTTSWSVIGGGTQISFTTGLEYGATVWVAYLY